MTGCQLLHTGREQQFVGPEELQHPVDVLDLEVLQAQRASQEGLCCME